MKLTRGTINSYINDQAVFDYLKAKLPDLNGKVLDIGCGKMRHKETVLSGNKVTEYIGLDLEEGRFAYAVDADLYWDGIRIPLEDKEIDNALLFEVLEHCADPSLVLKEAFRVLKPGGVLLFSTPFVYQLHGIPYDFQRLTPFGANELFLKAGFSRVDIESSGSFDISLGQMISVWITHRPMPFFIRKVLSASFVPFLKLLIRSDKKLPHRPPFTDGGMISGIIGKAYKT